MIEVFFRYKELEEDKFCGTLNLKGGEVLHMDNEDIHKMMAEMALTYFDLVRMCDEHIWLGENFVGRVARKNRRKEKTMEEKKKERGVLRLEEYIKALEEFAEGNKIRIVEAQEKLACVSDWNTNEWDVALMHLKERIRELDETNTQVTQLKAALNIAAWGE